VKNPAAVALGKMAKGVPKNFSRAERARRRQLMAAINQKRAERLKAKTARIKKMVFKAALNDQQTLF
jgi:hypothetical protein